MATKETSIEKKLDKEIATMFKSYPKNTSFEFDKTVDTYSDFISNKFLIIEVIRKGIPYSLFSLIQHYTPFSEKEWADILDISTKSLLRYKQESKQFKSIQSEKIIEMAEVTTVGLDVFGTMEKFKLWLDTPNFALGNIKPLELVRDSYGKELVIGELTRINYGILV